MTIVIWIIDDDEGWRAEAKERIRQVLTSKGVKFELEVSSQIVYPPIFDDREKTGRRPHPHIVVLDLLDHKHTTEHFQGRAFYRALREHDQDRGFRRSFIIIWSAYAGEEVPEIWVEETLSKDNHVVALRSKTLFFLEQAVRNLVDRVNLGC